MKDQQQEAKGEEETSGGGGGGGAVWDCGSPLYDSYELASVYHLLDRHLMVLPFYQGSGRYSGRRSYDEADEPRDGPSASKGRRVAIVPGKTAVGGSHRRRRGREKAKKEKKNKIGLLGMWTAIAFWKK